MIFGLNGDGVNVQNVKPAPNSFKVCSHDTDLEMAFK